MTHTQQIVHAERTLENAVNLKHYELVKFLRQNSFECFRAAVQHKEASKPKLHNVYAAKLQCYSATAAEATEL
jgi:hypothetical protein